MTYFDNSNHIIETDDIHEIQGVNVTQEDGKTVGWFKTILNPAKDFQAAKNFWVHLTNGIEHRTIGPIPPLTPLVPPSPATSSTDNETTTSTTNTSVSTDTSADTPTDTSTDTTTTPSPDQPTEDDAPTGPIPAVTPPEE